MNNSDDSTSSTISPSTPVRLLSSEDPESSGVLLQQPILSPRSKAMCDSPRSWSYSANGSNSEDIRVDVMDVAEHQTDILLSSHYSDSWSGLELDHEEAGRVECQGTHGKFSLDMYDGDSSSAPSLQRTVQAGTVVWEDDNSIVLDTIARSRSRCPSRDLYDLTPTYNSETATTTVPADCFHDSCTTYSSTTETLGIGEPAYIIAGATAARVLWPKHCSPSAILPRNEFTRDPAVEIKVTCAAPQRRKRQRKRQRNNARSNISTNTSTHSDNSGKRIQSGSPIASRRRRLRRGAKRQ